MEEGERERERGEGGGGGRKPGKYQVFIWLPDSQLQGSLASQEVVLELPFAFMSDFWVCAFDNVGQGLGSPVNQLPSPKTVTGIGGFIVVIR